MQIFHPLDDFFFALFPNLKGGGKNLIISELQNYYTHEGVVPQVEIQDNVAVISFKTPLKSSEEKDYQQVIQWCEKGNYAQAKPLLQKLIAQNPSKSEYHRILGQILSDEGHPNLAINTLIDALKWDTQNNYALIMMGNIYARDLDDVEGAMIFYDQVVKNNPKDYIALNNIGANLLRQNKATEAIKYFEKAHQNNPNYANIYAGLGMANAQLGKYSKAFEYLIQGIKIHGKTDDLHKHLLGNAYGISQKVMTSNLGELLIEEVKEGLEQKGRLLEIIKDESIPTAAKIEFAENYNRTIDVVKYNPNLPGYAHLVLHEFMHLQLVLEARENNENQLFISNNQHFNQFQIKIQTYKNSLLKKSFPSEVIDKVIKDLFDGLNRQIFNSAPDLFIEDRLYQQFPDIKAIQFVSLYNLLQESIKAVTNPQIVEISDAWVLSTSKILNLVNALQFKDLFGVDVIADFKATAKELAQAQEFYTEFKDYQSNKLPAEEYELIQNWAKDLELDAYFELVNENEYRKEQNFGADILQKIAQDPFDTEEEDEEKQQEHQQFLANQEKLGLNTAVSFFMVEALQYFKNIPSDKIKEIAMEIALQGAHGYHPDKKYKLNKIPQKTFTGNQILAYYYVSWALALPDMLPQLQLPFDNEYQMAKKLTDNE